MENTTNFGSLPTQSVTQPLTKISPNWSEVKFAIVSLLYKPMPIDQSNTLYVHLKIQKKEEKILILPSCGFIPYTPYYEKKIRT